MFPQPIEAILSSVTKLNLSADRISAGRVDEVVRLVETQREAEVQAAAVRAQDDTVGQLLDELA